MSGYTKGIWEVKVNMFGEHQIFERNILVCTPHNAQDAFRITACHNACIGIKNLEPGVVKELVYLLKTCLPIIERHEEYLGLFCSIGEALSKIEGGV